MCRPTGRRLKGAMLIGFCVARKSSLPQGDETLIRKGAINMSSPSTVVDQSTADSTQAATNGNFITKQETYILVKDGEKNKVFPESDELLEQIEKAEVTEVARQSYLFYEPTNAEGVNELI